MKVYVVQGIVNYEGEDIEDIIVARKSLSTSTSRS
jgi:hypothetical protein